MAFGLIIVGDEILSGKRADKHLPQVIELLGARGLALDWARCVGDNPARITADLKDAFASGPMLFLLIPYRSTDIKRPLRVILSISRPRCL